MTWDGMRLRPVEVAGVRGAYAVAGTGPALVLLAAPLLLARTYRPTVARLARSFRVVAVELPGSHRGTRLAEPWDAERYADWVAGFLQMTGVEPAAVLGHSSSGAVALHLAVRHPGRVARLILTDSVGGEPRPLPLLIGGWLLDMLHEWRLALSRWPDVLVNALGHPRNFFHQVRLSADADLRGEAGKVRAPTLLAWGALDHTTPPRAAWALAERLPRAELYLSRRGGHDWALYRPEEFAAAVRLFMSTAAA